MSSLTAWPRQPFVGLSIAAAVGIACADLAPNHSALFLSAIAIVTLIAFVRRSSLATYASVAATFFFLHSLRVADSPGHQLARESGDDPRALSVRGEVVSEPRISPTGIATFFLHLQSIELDGARKDSRATVLARWKHPVEFGDEVYLFGTAEQIPPTRNPGEFDMGSYLARHDVRRQLIVRYPENGTLVRHTGGNFVLRAAQKSRRWLNAVLGRGLEDSPDVQSLISGMVLGLRHQTPDDIEEPFQQTGTLHLFAVAGLHVGIVAQLLWILATIARVPRKWAIACIVPVLLFYAALTGLHTSSVRAALMSSVLLAGFFAERKVFALNSLAAAAILILWWDTDELFSVGFQLSFAVVTTIVLLADPVFRWLRRLFQHDPFLPRSLFSRRRRIADSALWWFARAASVSFAAWIGSLPLMLWYYHLVTPISLIANLAVVPIAFFVLAGGLISIMTAPISLMVSVIFNNANWFFARVILVLVHLFARLPAGHLYVEHPHSPFRSRSEITILDVGSGAAIHVRTARQDWLIDTGNRRDFKRIVRDYLRSRGVNRLDRLLLTHGDAGHLGGASAAIHLFHPRRLIESAARDRSRTHQELIRELVGQRVARDISAIGDEWKLSADVSARVLFPPRYFEAPHADDQAMVVQLSIAPSSRALLMSDAGDATEHALMRAAIDLRADVIIKGQHYSGVSCSPEFLDAVRPKAIIATSRDFPENERIKDDWADALQARGIKLFRQDKTGAVRLRFLSNGWEVKGYLIDETFRNSTR